MKKFFLTLPNYTDWKLTAYQNYMAPRNKKYCQIHGYKYLELPFSPNIRVFEGISDGENVMFYRWKILKDAIEANKLQDNDIITMFDCDVYIAQLDKNFETKKSFTYAIDSGNTHCMGIFSLKVNSFTRKLINAITCQKRYNALKSMLLYKEDVQQNVTFYANDQHAYYHVAGIKPHSWVSFLDMSNYGFHTHKTDYTVFSIQELLDNVEILGPEWNTTHLIEETGDNGKPNYYDIVRIAKDRVINRHFAGGQRWLCEEWEQYSKKYILSSLP